MKCEICKTIDKLGLDPAAHDLWLCADAMSAGLAWKKTQVSIHHFCRELGGFFLTKWRDAQYMPARTT